MPTAEEIRNPSDNELKLLGAAAAERGAGFCRVFGSDEQREWLRRGLHLMWAAVSDEATADDCLDHLDALGTADAESQDEEQDPTAHPGFYAEQSVGLVAEALVGSANPSAERVERALQTLRTLCSMVDFKLGGEVPVIVRSGDPRPAPGPLVRMELEAESELVARLTRARETNSNTASVDELRATAEDFARAVTSAVKAFAAASNWE
ncbi:hypothetical protein [Streptomyces althioticus]|uniref:hypothetical protein n=1 Tax=Streptomyces althioticus TaxID=83380 RepID=UPI0033CB44F7